MSFPSQINAALSGHTARRLHSFLEFPEGKSITALDFKAFNGKTLDELTYFASERYLYGAEASEYMAKEASTFFERVALSHYKREMKISNDAFSLAVVDPYIHPQFIEDIFMSYDPFQIPDFEAEIRQQQQSLQSTADNYLDLNQLEMTEEEVEKRKVDMEERIQKAIEDRNIAYRKALREQEKRTSALRDDKLLLTNAARYLKPGGILIMLTPKEFIDAHISFKLANAFEDIQIFRLDDSEYEKHRKCVIIAKKRLRTEKQDTLPYEIMQTKYKPYKDIPVISVQEKPLYKVPEGKKEDVVSFRIGPITPEEVQQVMRKSMLVENYAVQHGITLDNITPKPPTQLHKGHVSLTLASGLLNGYIGTGADRHLVKGSVVKKNSEFTEEEETDRGTEIKTVDREYFHIGIKYLDRHGDFHKLL
ncbi:hypothetical protein TCA2_4410 [Paenibacillus sp. TCA20]|uniref:DUF6094 domain-containing protein n=1 Tax=Paenibacillus urinalis TaxID=521520 RepID=A0ABY7XNN9_9BACL|nr:MULTISPECIES: DUF6094 domain-containing protein [Paenibacillus]WDI05250.1 DUF6094 domain-containing protein [Paenibacillus urinalis]GAK41918.1 hypothetical protein TCA2_4410 [Paenibacillus sp. TCA20]